MTPREKQKEHIHRLHEKYYGKKKSKEQIPGINKVAAKETDRETALRIAPDLSPSPKEGIIMAAGSTRNSLMLQCKERGVKNFRVLNKQELSDVLKNIGDQKAVDAIVAGAVARWKSGWGKNSQLAGKDHKE